VGVEQGGVQCIALHVLPQLLWKVCSNVDMPGTHSEEVVPLKTDQLNLREPVEEEDEEEESLRACPAPRKINYIQYACPRLHTPFSLGQPY